jgi:hypothetical protein
MCCTGKLTTLEEWSLQSQGRDRQLHNSAASKSVVTGRFSSFMEKIAASYHPN